MIHEVLQMAKRDFIQGNDSKDGSAQQQLGRLHQRRITNSANSNEFLLLPQCSCTSSGSPHWTERQTEWAEQESTQCKEDTESLYYNLQSPRIFIHHNTTSRQCLHRSIILADRESFDPHIIGRGGRGRFCAAAPNS